MKEEIPKISNFPVGDKLPEIYSKYFVGQAYLAPLTKNIDLNCPIANVTFEPGCRNNWHSHTGGQILVVIAGKGYYQSKGEPARLLLPGDVVEIPTNVIHWHGAAPDSWFSHLAIETNPQNNQNTWLEDVDDEQYKKATGTSNSIVVIPKSIHKERIIENFNIFDFELAKEDMDAIVALDMNRSSFLDHRDPEIVKWLSTAVF